MSKKIKVISGIIAFCFITILSSTVYGAGASISAGSTNLTVGQSTTINVSVSSSEAWALKVSSNGGSLSGTTSNADAAGEEVSKSVISATFSSSSEGTYTISLTGDVTGSDLKKQSVSKSVTITVKAPVEGEAPGSPSSSSSSNGSSSNNSSSSNSKSSNCNLSNLGIRPNDFSGFTASKTSYSVSVPNDVSSIEVYASKGVSSQSISGTGNKSLSVGENTFSVTVTAEDGTQKTYKIIVTRLAESEKESEEKEEEKITELALTNLSITNGKLNEVFDPSKYEYTVDLDGKEENLDIEASTNIETAKVEISGEKDLKTGENIVIVKVTSEDGDTIKEYKITVTKGIGEEVEEVTSNIVEEDKKSIDGLAGRIVAFVICVMLLTVAAILFALLNYLAGVKLGTNKRMK